MEILAIKNQIEDLRVRLNSMVSNENNNGANNQVVKLSQELDILINKYMEITKK